MCREPCDCRDEAAGSRWRYPNVRAMRARNPPSVWPTCRLHAGAAQSIVECHNLTHSTPAAACEMAKISGLQRRMLLPEASSQHHVRFFQRPHFDSCAGGKRQRRVKGRQSPYR